MNTTELNLNQIYFPLNPGLSTFNDSIVVDENGSVLIDPTIIEDSQDRYYIVLIDNAINSLSRLSNNLSAVGMTEEEFYQKLSAYNELKNFLSSQNADDLTAFADLTAFDDISSFGISEDDKKNVREYDEDIDGDWYNYCISELQLGMAIGKKIRSDVKKLYELHDEATKIGRAHV